jgi:four helix bundle protein
VQNRFSFEDLTVFNESVNFSDEVYRVTSFFPKEEVFNLTSQFRRAANSISLNIGEGSGGTDSEFINFLRIARRSINECVVCIILARQQNYLNEEIEEKLRQHLTTLSKMISGLIKSIERRKQDQLTVNP